MVLVLTLLGLVVLGWYLIYRDHWAFDEAVNPPTSDEHKNEPGKCKCKCSKGDEGCCSGSRNKAD